MRLQENLSLLFFFIYYAWTVDDFGKVSLVKSIIGITEGFIVGCTMGWDTGGEIKVKVSERVGSVCTGL
mgnify:CR=1 FL=1